jgi:hypothetical protein
MRRLLERRKGSELPKLHRSTEPHTHGHDWIMRVRNCGPHRHRNAYRLRRLVRCGVSDSYSDPAEPAGPAPAPCGAGPKPMIERSALVSWALAVQKTTNPECRTSVSDTCGPCPTRAGREADRAAELEISTRQPSNFTSWPIASLTEDLYAAKTNSRPRSITEMKFMNLTLR